MVTVLVVNVRNNVLAAFDKLPMRFAVATPVPGVGRLCMIVNWNVVLAGTGSAVASPPVGRNEPKLVFEVPPVCAGSVVFVIPVNANVLPLNARVEPCDTPLTKNVPVVVNVTGTALAEAAPKPVIRAMATVIKNDFARFFMLPPDGNKVTGLIGAAVSKLNDQPL